MTPSTRRATVGNAASGGTISTEHRAVVGGRGQWGRPGLAWETYTVVEFNHAEQTQADLSY